MRWSLLSERSQTRTSKDVDISEMPMTNLTNPGIFRGQSSNCRSLPIEFSSCLAPHSLSSFGNYVCGLYRTYETRDSDMLIMVKECTVDFLTQLCAEMLRNPSDGIPSDGMSRLAYHVLCQRSSFNPLYPPAEDVQLDLSLAPDTLHISSIPNILILPSDMKYSVRKDEGEEQVKCMCINPGTLAKGDGAIIHGASLQWDS